MKTIFTLIFCLTAHTIFAQNNNLDSSKMKKLLKEISNKAIELGEINPELTKNQLNSLWIGYEPATEKEIDSLEKRLGIQLPKDYRDFLQITNGFFCSK